MSLFYSNYKCHPGAIVMRKCNGMLYRVRGNISLWDMTAILDPFDPDKPDYYRDSELDDILAIPATRFSEMFLILDEGVDHLAEALKFK